MHLHNVRALLLSALCVARTSWSRHRAYKELSQHLLLLSDPAWLHQTRNIHCIKQCSRT